MRMRNLQMTVKGQRRMELSPLQQDQRVPLRFLSGRNEDPRFELSGFG
jgi:hypothetical protein